MTSGIASAASVTPAMISAGTCDRLMGSGTSNRGRRTPFLSAFAVVMTPSFLLIVPGLIIGPRPV
jgi:hypothetical protein